MNYQSLADFDPEIKHSITKELQRQEEGLEMIPSENFVSPAVLEALGSVLLTNIPKDTQEKDTMVVANLLMR